MADYAVPKSGVAYIYYGCLVDQADTKLFKSAPTLATGDFKVSIDGGAFANLATLPTNTPGTFSVKFSLSSGEMTGDNILVVAHDAAGAEWCDQCWNIQTAPRGIADLAYPATTGRSMVVDAAGLVDANTVKVGPTGSGTAQTARDIGASVLLSSGTGAGQLDFTSGVVKGNVTQLLGTAWLTPGTAGTPDVNVKLWNGLTTVALPLTPTTAGRTLDVSTGGEAGVDWANVGSPTTTLALTGTTIATTQKVDVETIKTNPVVNAGTITFPTGATLASTTNITAGTITTATNVTTVNGLAANVITAAATASDFGAEIATAIWTDTTAGDFTVALSVGKSLMNGVTLGTGLTVARCTLTDTLTTYTGNTVQTGDSFARIGATGSGLTSLAPSSTALSTAQWTNTLATNLGTTNSTVATNLDTTVSSRSTLTQTQVTGGAYSIQSASCVLGDARIANLDATVSSRLASASYTAPDNTSVAAIKVKTDFLPSATAGAAGGLHILGANAAAATSYTGNASAAITYTGGTNSPGVSYVGTGTGAGQINTGGATGHGISAVGGATSGDGISAVGTTSGHGLTVTGAGTTKHGVNATGGATSSRGISAVGGGSGAGFRSEGGINGHGVQFLGGVTSGDGMDLQAQVSGHGLSLIAAGSSKYGLKVVGGDAGTSDGINVAAGTGGVGVRYDTLTASGATTLASLVANITGNLSGSIGSVGTGGITASSFAAAAITSTVAPNLDAAVTSRMATYSQPTGFLAATFPSGTITNNTTTPTWYTAPGTAPTVGQIATAVWQDATAGDFTVASSIGKALYVANVAPGGAGGHFIAGSNAATTFATLTVTGAFTASSASNNIGGSLALQNVLISGTLDVGGQITMTNSSNDIRGVKLAAAGLDSISATAPTALATTFPGKMLQLFERFFGKVVKNGGDLSIKVMQGTGSTPATTQTYTAAAGVETVNKAT